jgi:hypothetical protein
MGVGLYRECALNDSEPSIETKCQKEQTFTANTTRNGQENFCQ